MSANSSSYSPNEYAYMMLTLQSTSTDNDTTYTRTIRKVKVISAEYDLTEWIYTVTTTLDGYSFKLKEADLYSTLELAKTAVTALIKEDILVLQTEATAVQNLTSELV